MIGREASLNMVDELGHALKNEILLQGGVDTVRMKTPVVQGDRMPQQPNELA